MVKENGKDVVYIKSNENEDGIPREIELGTKDEENVHVLKGLKISEQLVLPPEEEER